MIGKTQREVHMGIEVETDEKVVASRLDCVSLVDEYKWIGYNITKSRGSPHNSILTC